MELISQFLDELGLCELYASSVIAVLCALGKHLNDFVLRLLKNLRELSLNTLHEGRLVEVSLLPLKGNSLLVTCLIFETVAILAVVDKIILQADVAIRGPLKDELVV